MQDVTVHDERPQIAIPKLQSVVQVFLNFYRLLPFGQSTMGRGLPLQLYRQRLVDLLQGTIAGNGEHGQKDGALNLHVGPLVALVQMIEQALVHGPKLGEGVVVEARACNSPREGREASDNRDQFVDDIIGDPQNHGAPVRHQFDQPFGREYLQGLA